MQIHPIDLHFQGRPQIIAAFLLESGGELALLETGPSTGTEALLRGIRERGFDPAEIKKVLLTHIHLDHAGAAGYWAGQGARIFVHERGARHLADPSKLIEGARYIYKDQMDTLWGEIRAVPEELITILKDGETVKLGRETLTALDTPGHAKHHLAYLTGGVIFTGDVAGVRLPGNRYIAPATAPSQFDPEEYDASILRLREVGADKLYLTHFGEFDDPENHLDRYRDMIRDASEMVKTAVQRGDDLEDIQHEYGVFTRQRALGEVTDGAAWARYEEANPSNMCAEGIVQYWRKVLKN